MAAEPQLDAPGGARKGRVILFLTVVLIPGSPGFAQDHPSEEARLSAARKAFDAGHWEEAANLARGPADQSPDLDFLLGLALARQEKWSEAQMAFEAGLRKAPGDPRFFVELAGVAYKQRDFRTAKDRLRVALRLNPQDAFAREFLATIYFLEGNLEAALKYWNPEDKPPCARLQRSANPDRRCASHYGIPSGQFGGVFESANGTHTNRLRELRHDSASRGEKRLGRFEGGRHRFTLERLALCHGLP